MPTKIPDLDLTKAKWLKPKRSYTRENECVEVAFVDDAIAVRNSKDPAGPVLVFTRGEWDAFVAGAKDGEFDV